MKIFFTKFFFQNAFLKNFRIVTGHTGDAYSSTGRAKGVF